MRDLVLYGTDADLLPSDREPCAPDECLHRARLSRAGNRPAHGGSLDRGSAAQGRYRNQPGRDRLRQTALSEAGILRFRGMYGAGAVSLGLCVRQRNERNQANQDFSFFRLCLKATKYSVFPPSMSSIQRFASEA